MFMEQFKRAQIILLETDNKSNIWSHKGRRLYYNQNNPNDVDDEIRYNIYIISDDEIKEGDWVIHIGNPYFQFKESMRNLLCNDCKKIIATTNVELGYGDNVGFWKSLPQPSEQFIEKYIGSYNKGNIITDVLVEYETYQNTINYHKDIWKNFERIKINSKYNTITIKKLKDSFNLEEMYKLMDDYQDYLFKTNDPVKTFKEWFNLQ